MSLSRIHIHRPSYRRPSCDHPYRRPISSTDKVHAYCPDCGAAVSRFGAK